MPSRKASFALVAKNSFLGGLDYKLKNFSISAFMNWLEFLFAALFADRSIKHYYSAGCLYVIYIRTAVSTYVRIQSLSLTHILAQCNNRYKVTTGHMVRIGSQN